MIVRDPRRQGVRPAGARLTPARWPCCRGSGGP